MKVPQTSQSEWPQVRSLQQEAVVGSLAGVARGEGGEMGEVGVEGVGREEGGSRASVRVIEVKEAGIPPSTEGNLDASFLFAPKIFIAFYNILSTVFN